MYYSYSYMYIYTYIYIYIYIHTIMYFSIEICEHLICEHLAINIHRLLQNLFHRAAVELVAKDLPHAGVKWLWQW